MHRPKKISWPRVTAIGVMVAGVAYAPVAMTELWPYASPGAPAIGEWTMSQVVSPQYVAAALATRVGPYARSLGPLIVHSVLGGLLMLLGPLQLLTAVRQRVRLHRVFGVLYALAVYACMAGATVYLVRTDPQDAFSGPAFWITLATIGVGTALSVTFGIAAALAHAPDLHQRWMLLCYGFLMTAPLLRLAWGAIPWLFPGISMEDANRLAVAHLGSVAAFGALLASRATDRRRRAAGVEGTWVTLPVLGVAHAAGAAALGWIISAYAGWGAWRMLGAYLVPFAIVYAVLLTRSVRCPAGSWAREEWRIHLTALCLAPVLSAGAARVLHDPLGLAPRTALDGGVAIGCGMLAFAATAVVSVRIMYGREVLRRTRAVSPTAQLEAV